MLIGNNFALVIYGIFMGQFIVDNLTFMNLSVMNELTIVLIQTFSSNLEQRPEMTHGMGGS